MQIVIELGASSITDESVARPLLELLDAIEQFQPTRYTLNERDAWRAWDLEGAVVDLLTQRTLLFRVEGDGGSAVIATGKQGETPTLIIESDESPELDEGLLRRLPVGEIRRP